jgi:c-di-GMP-binding flagellar brake protein YcgR
MSEPQQEKDAQDKVPELLEPSEYDEYLLHERREILHVLRALNEQVCQITVFFNDGTDFILTTLLSVSDSEITLDYGADAELNQLAGAANKLFCITLLDKVRVQFILRQLQQTTYDGRPAFKAILPDSLLRLQRREYYRLTMPVTRRLGCQIPIPQTDGSVSLVDVDIVDISGGGIAIVAPPEEVRFESDMEFPKCRIELPDVGVIIAAIRVRTVFDITLRNGTHVKRSGCAFVNLPGAMATLIQRYIIKTERELKARESGLL